MTTHDYPGETNVPDDVDAARTGADPGWQQHADQFAADRNQHGDATQLSSETQPSSETSLFGDTDLEGFRGQWDSVQAGFVDDPKRCVEQADHLVSAVVEQLSSGFADARSRLEQQWSRGEDASTEDLRVALKRYREFFDRLLAV